MNSFAEWCGTGCTNGGTCGSSGCECPVNTYGPTCAQTYCSGSNLYTSTSGAFSDHTNGTFYLPFMNCSWLIPPSPEAESIVLSFDEFSTELNYDCVLVYAGYDDTGVLLGNYSGPLTLLQPDLIISGPARYITFESDEFVESSGFTLSWQSYTCPSATVQPCSGHGYCSAGACLCYEGFQGITCNQTYCPNSCSGNGQCVNNQCQCQPGWTSGDCDICTNSLVCPNAGTCTFTQVQTADSGVIEDVRLL
jgi:hypothetical protein